MTFGTKPFTFFQSVNSFVPLLFFKRKIGIIIEIG